MSDLCNITVIKKSRKSHKCIHCWLEIPKGSSYKLVKGIFDNVPYTVKAHRECEKAYVEFNSDSSHSDWAELHESDDFKEHQKTIKEIYKLASNTEIDDK